MYRPPPELGLTKNRERQVTMKKIMVLTVASILGFILLFQKEKETEVKYVKATTHPPPQKFETKLETSSEETKKNEKKLSVLQRAKWSDNKGQQYRNRVEELFLDKALTSMNKDEVNQHLRELNSAPDEAITYLIKTLAMPAGQDSEVVDRMAYVDYLKYRSLWDETTRKKVADFVVAPLPDVEPQNIRFLAALIGDKKELVQALARADWNQTLDVIAAIKHPVLQKHAAVEALMERLDAGYDESLVRNEIYAVAPIINNNLTNKE